MTDLHNVFQWSYAIARWSWSAVSRTPATRPGPAPAEADILFDFNKATLRRNVELNETDEGRQRNRRVDLVIQDAP